MYRVTGTHITLTRGDTFMAKVNIIKDGEAYTPTAQDAIRFALKKDYGDQNPLLNITIPYDTMTLTIQPNQTKTMAFGDYKYDIEITFEDGTVNTFIYEADFTIAPEVL